MIRNETNQFSRSVMIRDTESESLSKQVKYLDMSFNPTLVKILSKSLDDSMTVNVVINNSNNLGLSSAELTAKKRRKGPSSLKMPRINLEQKTDPL